MTYVLQHRINIICMITNTRNQQWNYNHQQTGCEKQLGIKPRMMARYTVYGIISTSRVENPLCQCLPCLEQGIPLVGFNQKCHCKPVYILLPQAIS